MENTKELFNTEELIRFQVEQKERVQDAVKIPLLISIILLAVLALAVVAYSEYEIVYRIFDYLAGENHEYWSPGLMALTAATMIIGFHLLAQSNPHNPAVRIVERSVGILIPIYLIGMGILIASIIFGDGLSSLIQTETPVMIGNLPEVMEQGWIDAFFANVTNPSAVLTFSIGIGGLAIINIFVAHKLLTIISSNINDVFHRLSRAHDANQDYQAILNAQKEYARLSAELHDLLIKDDHYLRMTITNEVIHVIRQALLPHKKWLQIAQYSPEFRFEDLHRKVDPKQVAKDIAKIEAIRPQDIMDAMNPKLLEKSK